MNRPTPRPCAAQCGAEIKRATGLELCRDCSATAWQAFDARLEGATPTERQRALYEFFAGRNAPAIDAARRAS